MLQESRESGGEKEFSIGRSLVRSAGLIGALTLGSRVLGLARDIGAASLFGAGPEWDAFVFAWMLPNLFRRLFGEGALSAAFVPIFSEYLVKKTREEAWRLFNVVATCLFLLLAGIAVLGIGLSFPVESILSAHGGADLGLQFTLIRIIFPYLFLICLVALAMGLLNSLRHFAAPALAPIVLNIFWLAGIFIVAPSFGRTPAEKVTLLAVAVLIGGFAQVAIQVPAILRKGVRLRPVLDLKHPGLKKILVLLAPLLIGLAPMQINVFFDNLIARTMGRVGANSVLFYGNRLMQFPLALIGIALGTAVFPILSRYAARNEIEKVKGAASEALRLTLFVSVPASLGLALLARPVIRLFFEHGNFTPEAASRAAAVLVFYAAGVWIFCCLQIVVRIFYSMHDTKTPTKIAVGTMFLNLVLNLLLIGPLDAAGLALATTVTAAVNLGALIWVFHRQAVHVWGGGMLTFGLRLLAATGGMGAVCMVMLKLIPESAQKAGQLLSVFVPVAASVAVFLFLTRVLGIPELKTIVHAFFARRKGTPGARKS
ncbi:MAG: murein biosynthesis integral membrane protein MurJ [Planctomycetota bacterium]|nr:MAG: murein biosynthesis integral membrane protein MurJ [Planctomycetota bacterium]